MIPKLVAHKLDFHISGSPQRLKRHKRETRAPIRNIIPSPPIDRKATNPYNLMKTIPLFF
ncbi:MAG: hypothetical protein ACJAS4_003340 [Bacteriovoracaceae bacterium]|jgi:hypothetical protein